MPKKQTQAEKDALIAAAEEAERLEAEAEAQRLEEERLAREEEERRIDAERKEFRTQELELLATEAEAGLVEAVAFASRLQAEEEIEAKRIEWENHVNCVSDITSENAVNTFISLASAELPDDLKQAVEECAETETIASAVTKLVANAIAASDLGLADRSRAMCQRLRATSAAKLDHAALSLVQRPDEFMVDEQVFVMHEKGKLKSGVWANVITKSFRGPAKPIVFKELGLQVDIPKQLNQMKLALRVNHIPYDSLSEQSVQLSPYLVVGGLLQVEFVLLPQPPKTVKGMVMRASSVLGSSLQRVPYGDEHGASAITAPLKVSLHVPPSVYFVPSEEDRKVLFWDYHISQWTTEGVLQDQHSLLYNDTTRLLQFTTTKSGFFALAQSRAADLPYRSWSVAPALEEKAADSPLDIDENEEGCVHFTLSTPRVEQIKIQVRGAMCQLIDPPILGLHLKPLSPGELLFALCDAGLNLMPLDADAQDLEVKSPALEAKVYRDIALVASAFDVKSSRWNVKLSKDRSAFQVRETSVYTGGNAETLDYFMALVEADTESLSHRLAPGIGQLADPGMKCALIQQSEEYTPPPPPPPEESPIESEEEKVEDKAPEAAAETAKAEGEEGAGDAAQPEAGEAKDEADKQDGSEEVEAKANDESSVAKEPFNEECISGNVSHVYLSNALRAASSVEAMERVDRTPLKLVKTVEQLLRLVRPVSFA